VEESEIISRLKYLSIFGEMIPNDILGENNLLVPNDPAVMPYSVVFVENEVYLYGVGAESREEYESGKASSVLISNDTLNNSLFQQFVCEKVEELHIKLMLIGEKNPNLKNREQEIYKELVLDSTMTKNIKK